MQISENGINFIKQFEGLFLNAYPDQKGVWTIGYGTIKYPNGEAVKAGDTCTVEQANIWLQYELAEKATHLNSFLQQLSIDFNQNEFDAVCSFIYNLGIGLLDIDRSFGIALRTKDKNKIADSMLLYCKYTKLGFKFTSQGLLNRRKAERELFLKVV